MCGRYTVSKAQEVLGEFFGAEFSETHIPVFNASPGQHLPVIMDAEPGRIVPVLWGIRPDWQPSRFLINARSETVSSLSTFREAFRERRCLVIADGFYEWKADEGRKQPFRIVRADDQPFAFAGIWEGGESPSFLIVTTEANGLMRPIHDRMPVILNAGGREAWIDRDAPDAGLQALLRPVADDVLRTYPVSTKVNNSRNQGPELIEAVGEPDREDTGDSGTNGPPLLPFGEVID